jgi:hypothetical protein
MADSEERSTVNRTNNQNEKFKNEIAFLKDQMRRLSNELILCQKTTGMGISSSDMATHIVLPTWMEDEQIMSPLLLAYDSRIHDLGTYMEQQGAYLDAVTERSARVLKENEALRSKFMSKIEKTPIRSDLPTGNPKEPRSEEHRSVVEENELLRQQSELLAKELHEANKIIATRDKDVMELNTQIKSKFEAISELGKAIQNTSKNKSLCEKELSWKIQEIVRLKHEISTLSTNIDELRRDRSGMKAECAVASCERSRLERESETLMKKVNAPFRFVTQQCVLLCGLIIITLGIFPVISYHNFAVSHFKPEY